jgi:hypothetical protein
MKYQKHKPYDRVGESLDKDDEEDKKTIKIGEDSQRSFIEEGPIRKPIRIKSRN